MTWSFRKLVRDHGEDRALQLLQDQIGYGEFRHNISKRRHMERDTPYNDVQDNTPLKIPVTTLTMLRINAGVHQSLWRKIKNTSST